VFSHSSLCDLFFLPLKQLSCLATTAAVASRTHSDVYFGWVRVDKKSVHAKIKCNIFLLHLSHSVFILCIRKFTRNIWTICVFGSWKIKHIAFICSSSSSLLLSFIHPHAAATVCVPSLLHFVVHFSALWDLHACKKTYIFASYQQSLARLTFS
jgi:hypothetical protein